MNENQDNQQDSPVAAAAGAESGARADSEPTAQASAPGDSTGQAPDTEPAAERAATPPPYMAQESASQSNGGSPNAGQSNAGQSSSRFFQWIRSLGIRRGSNRWVGGVCSGLAEKWNIDPVIVRGLAVVLTLFFGVGLFAYGVAWALLPEPDGRIHAEEVTKGHWSSGTTGAAAMVLFGLAGPGQSVAWGAHDRGFSWGGPWIIGAIVVTIWAVRRKKFQNRGGNNGHQGNSWQNRQHPNRHHRNQWNTWQGPSDPYAAQESSPSAPASSTSSTSSSSSSSAASQASASLPYTAPSWKGGSQASWRTANWPESDPEFDGAGFTNTGEPIQAYGPQGPAGPLGTVKAKQAAALKRRSRLGAPATLLTFGLAVIVGAVILLLNQSGALNLNGYAFATALAAAAVTMGLAIVISGFTGRTAGGLGTLSIIALALAGLSSIGHLNFDNNRFGNQAWAPQTVAQAESGFSAAFGNSTIDLTSIDSASKLSSDVTVPFDLAASKVTIKVPSSIPVTVQSDLAAANLTVEGSAGGGGSALVQSTTMQINPKATGKGIIITLDGAATNVTIVPVAGK